MSVSFYLQVHGEHVDTGINMANGNAADLFRWLGLCPDLLWDYEPIDAHSIAVVCRRRTWDVPRNHDPGRAGSETGGPGTGQCRVIEAGRPADYLRDRTAALLRACEQALAADRDASLHWG